MPIDFLCSKITGFILHTRLIRGRYDDQGPSTNLIYVLLRWYVGLPTGTNKSDGFATNSFIFRNSKLLGDRNPCSCDAQHLARNGSYGSVDRYNSCIHFLIDSMLFYPDEERLVGGGR